MVLLPHPGGEFPAPAHASAAKQIRKLPVGDHCRVTALIGRVSEDPWTPGVKKLAGGEGELRVRAGDFRVVYEVSDDVLLVPVLRVAHRREVYRSLR